MLDVPGPDVDLKQDQVVPVKVWLLVLTLSRVSCWV